MKKYLLFFAIILIVKMSAQSQNWTNGFYLAPTYNFNTNKINENGWKTLDGSGGLGFKAGIFQTYNIVGNYHFQYGLMGHYLAFNTKNENEHVIGLDIPLTLKIELLNLSNDIDLTSFFGAQISLFEGGTRENTKILSGFNSSIIGGVGLEYELNETTLGIDFSLSLGLNNMIEDNPDDILTLKNYASIGFYFIFNNYD